ncbi:hypothetical protein ACTQY8_08575 [Collinsella bouchesdurhonensis]|uniref:hypothetical protein n=1 Tax=Collinsella bouchesdurhonensis TaxID=1907654 RepID=UPI003F8F9901
MDGEGNGKQKNPQAQEEQIDTTAQQEAPARVEGGGNAPDQEKAIAERDEKIASLKAQIAEAAKTAEQAEKLSAEIAELKQASADERIDFALQLAGCSNVKAARAVLDDYEGDVDKLREGEPWLFAKHAAGHGNAPSGKTGLLLVSMYFSPFGTAVGILDQIGTGRKPHVQR